MNYEEEDGLFSSKERDKPCGSCDNENEKVEAWCDLSVRFS